MSVALKLNEKSLVQNLRFAFSKGTTYFAELLQNARRSGATQIQVTALENTIIVSDDGCGIADFQKLFTLAESGWEQEVVDAERPYGMGFISCLFAADYVEVESNSRFVAFSTEDILDFSHIDVIPVGLGASPHLGTKVTLSGLKNSLTPAQIVGLCKGFPLPVVLNGEEIDRPHSIDNRHFSKTDIGLVSAINDPVTAPFAVYLQGFSVMGNTEWATNVVHLDTTKFFGRIPDRDKLVDQDSVIPLVRKAIFSVWTQKLFPIMQRVIREPILQQQLFLRSHGNFLIANPETRPWLDQFAVLPPQLGCAKIDIIAKDNDEMLYYYRDITKRDIETGTLIAEASDLPDPEDSQSMALQALFRAVGVAVISRLNICSSHWAVPNIVSFDNDIDVDLEANILHSRVVSLTYFAIRVVLVDKIRLSAEVCRGSESLLLEAEIDDDPVYHNGAIYVPEKSSGMFGPRQAISYYDGDTSSISEQDMERDDDLIVRHVKSIRNNDPAKLLSAILSSDIVLPDYPQLAGKQFTVSIQENGRLDFVRLAPSED